MAQLIPDRSNRIRILQVCGAIPGGVGGWLLNVLGHIDRKRFKMDFLIYNPFTRGLEEKVKALGGEVIFCPAPNQPLAFARAFKRGLQDNGPYDVVHSHLHHFSGFVLRLAKSSGVPIRIAHSHTDLSQYRAGAGFFKGLYFILMKRWINLYATGALAVSRQAAADLLGPAWPSDPRWRVHHCSIDLQPFFGDVSSAAVRDELDIPPDALVIGHVGSFNEGKNHSFLLEIAAEVSRLEPKTMLALIGVGQLRPAIERQVHQAGLAERTRFLGFRPDVPRLMRGAMDIFLFPSLFEGLPLVLLEAQAAGLPCIYSDVITDEVEVVPPLMRRVSLTRSAADWAEAVLSARKVRELISPSKALAITEQSSFNIISSVKKLEQYFEDGFRGVEQND